MRADDDANYSLPPQGTQVKLELHDPYYDTGRRTRHSKLQSPVYSMGEFILPVDGKLGAYSLHASLVDASESSTAASIDRCRLSEA